MKLNRKEPKENNIYVKGQLPSSHVRNKIILISLIRKDRDLQVHMTKLPRLNNIKSLNKRIERNSDNGKEIIINRI